MFFAGFILYSMSVTLPMISDFAGRSINATSQPISNLPYSRMCEAEADAIGIYLMALAGYNPERAVEVWDMFQNIQLEAAQTRSRTDRSSAYSVTSNHLQSRRCETHESFDGRRKGRWRARIPLWSSFRIIRRTRHCAVVLRERHLAGALRLYRSRATAPSALEREMAAADAFGPGFGWAGG
ncbi:hypothetical protein BJ742DRAFT_286150 [Cladochytrium replicatum]|nr:hypothetical protein BJ742DRAFT_286150 [Cladochytrium replicatum]